MVILPFSPRLISLLATTSQVINKSNSIIWPGFIELSDGISDVVVSFQFSSSKKSRFSEAPVH